MSTSSSDRAALREARIRDFQLDTSNSGIAAQYSPTMRGPGRWSPLHGGRAGVLWTNDVDALSVTGAYGMDATLFRPALDMARALAGRRIAVSEAFDRIAAAHAGGPVERGLLEHLLEHPLTVT